MAPLHQCPGEAAPLVACCRGDELDLASGYGVPAEVELLVQQGGGGDDTVPVDHDGGTGQTGVPVVQDEAQVLTVCWLAAFLEELRGLIDLLRPDRPQDQVLGNQRDRELPPARRYRGAAIDATHIWLAVSGATARVQPRRRAGRR